MLSPLDHSKIQKHTFARRVFASNLLSRLVLCRVFLYMIYGNVGDGGVDGVCGGDKRAARYSRRERVVVEAEGSRAKEGPDRVHSGEHLKDSQRMEMRLRTRKSRRVIFSSEMEERLPAPLVR